MSRIGKGFVRFPHTCRIYNVVGADNFSDGEEITFGKVVAVRKSTHPSVRSRVAMVS